MKKLIKKVLKPFYNKYNHIISEIETNRILTAKLLIKEMPAGESTGRFNEYEFKVFSQSGEDGIIQHLLSRIPIDNDIFIEFGVEDYSESNTRFLLQNNNWRGLVLDGSAENISSIKSRGIYWRHELTALQAFITKENINELIKSAGISGDIGLLSIDIDGNDYWVWEAIDVVSPRIVICEYNSVFGSKEAISVPYDPLFFRTAKHYSNLYFGASLKALCTLAEKKGYIFAGSSSSGANAFFIRKDVSDQITPVNCETGYVKSRARESRDPNGTLTFISGDIRREVIAELEVVDVVSGKIKKIKELLF